MAENTMRKRIISASAAVVFVAGTIAFTAAPASAVSYPSWDDVQQAKSSVGAKQQMIDRVNTLIGTLQTSLNAASTAAEKANEAYFEAKDKLQAATAKADNLDGQAKAAQADADKSMQQAGTLAGQMSRSGSQSIPSQLLLSKSKQSENLLYRIGTMSNLTGHFQSLNAQAQKDANTASSLTASAKAAETARAKASTAAQTALDQAQAAQAKAQSAVSAQQEQSQVLVTQLASLKDTSAQVEQGYLNGQAAARAAAAAAAAARAAAAAAAAEAARKAAEQAAQQHPKPPAWSGGGSSSSGGSSGGSSSPGGGGGSVGAPQGNVVETAIAYAYAQLGKPYIFGGEGPYGYDCSGLTMKAYGAAGRYIGSHSVNNQYYTAAGRGEILPYSQRQRGDLIFWGDAPGDLYHVGLYLGGGMMIAAPTEGSNVKVQSVWGTPYSKVARPTA